MVAAGDTESDTEFLVLGGKSCRIRELQPTEGHLASLDNSPNGSDLAQWQILVDPPDRLTYGTEDYWFESSGQLTKHE
jgi:hypothetical protein